MRLTRATRHALHQVVVAGTLSNACNAVDSGRRDKRFSGLHSARSGHSQDQAAPRCRVKLEAGGQWGLGASHGLSDTGSSRSLLSGPIPSSMAD